MWKNNRPEGWKETKDEYFKNHDPDIGHQNIYEDSADALLEALKREGKYIDASKYPYGFVLNDIVPVQKIDKDFKGWLIIIPDD